MAGLLILKFRVAKPFCAGNHFVHGSEAEFDYVQHFGPFAFLVNTLEFVFAVADLTELGWSFQNWREHRPGLSTEFGAYVTNYKNSLAS